MGRRAGRAALICGATVVGSVLIPIASAVHAAVITVTTTADDFTVNGNCTLREAIVAVDTGQAVDACPAGASSDHISLPFGTYTLTVPGTGEDLGHTGDLDITRGMTIDANGSTIDGGGLDRVLEVHPFLATATINRATIRNGYFQVNGDPSIQAEAMGGGIFNGGSLYLNDTVVTGNVLDFGSSGPGNGAGIGNGSNAFLTLTRSRIVGNGLGNSYPSGGGGGIANVGNISMIDTTISDNHSWTGGGGIDNNGNISGAQNTISGNSTGCFECSALGGGIYNAGNVTLTNSTISSNAANAGDYTTSAGGGGVYSSGNASLRNVTIADNIDTAFCDTHCFTGPSGGGLDVAAGASVDLANTIVADNTTRQDYSASDGRPSVTTASDCVGAPTSNGYNLVRTTAGCGFVSQATDVLGVDPRLGKLQGNGGPTWTHNLLPGSPAIDAANPAAPASGGYSCPPRDQRGMPRSDDGNLDGTQRCDIGAVEAVALDSTSDRVQFDGWSGASDATASGGGYRFAATAGAAATFAQTSSTATSSVAVMTYKGPNMGKATIAIDGVVNTTVDLYAAGSPTRATLTYSVPSSTSHSIRVTVLGTKNAASSGTQVRVDGFKTGTALVDDASPSVRYGYWTGGRDGRAIGGEYRIGAPGGRLTFDTVGPVFTLITERGPSFGKAQITIDGTSHGRIDFYSASTTWLSRQTYSGLGAGTHHVVITVLGIKNPASSGTSIVFDAVTLR